MTEQPDRCDCPECKGCVIERVGVYPPNEPGPVRGTYVQPE